MKRNALVVFSVITILLLSGSFAMAAWTGTPGNKPVMIGVNYSLTFAATTTTAATYTLGAAEALNVGDFITFNLTGGAVFSANTLTITTATGSAALVSGTGLAGQTQARFRVTALMGASSTIVFNTNAVASVNVSAVPAGSNVDFTLSLETATGTTIVGTQSCGSTLAFPFTGTNLLTIVNTPGTNTADVMAATGPYTKFLNNQTTGTATNFDLNTVAPGIPATFISANKILVTIAGDFNGITRVDGTGLTGSDSAGSITGGTAGRFMINSTKTAAYAVNTAALTAAGIGVDPIFYIDGTTTQVAREYTITVSNFADGATYDSHTWITGAQNYKILRNGVYFSANSLGTYNTVKISERSGIVPTGGATVFVQAWDVDGVRLAEATGVLPIALGANQTITLTGDQLAARFVGTPMKYEFFCSTTNAVISNVKKTPDGFGSNVFTNDNGGAI